MKKRNTQTKGYSIVEVLVAVMVLLVALAGPLTIAYKGLQSATLARQQNVAFFLAQEGIEAIIKKRNDGVLANENNSSVDTWDWTSEIGANNCSASQACGVDLTGNARGSRWALFNCSSPPSGWSCDLYYGSYLGNNMYLHQQTSAPSGYHRDVYLRLANDNSYVHVVSEVSWTTAGGADQEIRLETYLYDIYGNN